MQIKDKSTVAFLFLLKPLKQGPLEDPATRENSRLFVTENNFQVRLYCCFSTLLFDKKEKSKCGYKAALLITKFVPLSLKIHWSALFRVLKIKLLNGRGQPPSTPTCTPPPPPPAVQGERQSAILCFLAIYSYRACKQALLWYPVVRGWGREKGKSHHQSALGELARRLSILESSVQCRRGSCLPSYHYVEHLFSGLFCKHVSWMLDIQLLIQQIWFVLVKECYSEELHTSDP